MRTVSDATTITDIPLSTHKFGAYVGYTGSVPTEYRLQSMVCALHTTEGKQKHYVAVVADPKDSGWYEHDDQNPSPVYHAQYRPIWNRQVVLLFYMDVSPP